MGRIVGSYKQTFITGAMTTIAAETASAGHILALRIATAGRADRLAILRAMEVELLVQVAFGAAQEVGFSLWVARAYTAAHTSGTALVIAGNDGKRKTGYQAPQLTGRIANTGALTAGTQTLDDNPLARGSFWAGAQGAAMPPRRFDFSGGLPSGISKPSSLAELQGIELADQEGVVLTNSILMGATGVVVGRVTVEWDEMLKNAA